MMISAMHIIYLHGFNSSPQSLKAQETARWLQQHAPDVTLHCPQLSPHPAKPLPRQKPLLSLPADTALIGSSLGATTPPPWQKNMAARPR
jgi:predicted esterase YcpF (UPF0227 family)